MNNGTVDEDQDKKSIIIRFFVDLFKQVIYPLLMALIAAAIIAAIIYFVGGEEAIIKTITETNPLILASIALNIFLIIFLFFILIKSKKSRKNENKQLRNVQPLIKSNLLTQIPSIPTEKHSLPEIKESIKYYKDHIVLLPNPEKPWSINIDNEKLNKLEVDAKTLAFKYTDDPNVELTQFSLIVRPYGHDESPVLIWFYYFTTSRLQLIYSFDGVKICLLRKPEPLDSLIYFEKSNLPWNTYPKWDELLYTAFRIIKPITNEGHYWLGIKAAPPRKWELYIKDRKEQSAFSWEVGSSPEDYKPYVD